MCWRLLPLLLAVLVPLVAQRMITAPSEPVSNMEVSKLVDMMAALTNELNGIRHRAASEAEFWFNCQFRLLVLGAAVVVVSSVPPHAATTPPRPAPSPTAAPAMPTSFRNSRRLTSLLSRIIYVSPSELLRKTHLLAILSEMPPWSDITLLSNPALPTFASGV